MFKRGVSLFLCCLMIFSLLSNVVVSVYAVKNNNGQQTPSAQSTAVSFINFYNNANNPDISMDAMTMQDYYVMAVYMSNWIKPGETTLADILIIAFILVVMGILFVNVGTIVEFIINVYNYIMFIFGGAK